MQLKSPYKGRFKVSQIYKGVQHKGIDLVGIDSKDIYTTVTGIVEAARRDTHPTGGMGLYVRIKEDGTDRRFYFAHLSAASVKVGQNLKAGDPIGTEGSTGNSTGSHLHYEIRTDPDNMTFLDVSEISGIPNRLGMVDVKEKKIEEVTLAVGSKPVKGLLIDGVTYAPLREIIDALKSELEVTWDKAKGAGVKL
jgi:murein DD-endopeptidase MepM/ murein hydrolase activator NlpD